MHDDYYHHNKNQVIASTCDIIFVVVVVVVFVSRAFIRRGKSEGKWRPFSLLNGREFLYQYQFLSIGTRCLLNMTFSVAWKPFFWLLGNLSLFLSFSRRLAYIDGCCFCCGWICQASSSYLLILNAVRSLLVMNNTASPHVK